VRWSSTVANSTTAADQINIALDRVKELAPDLAPPEGLRATAEDFLTDGQQEPQQRVRDKDLGAPAFPVVNWDTGAYEDGLATLYRWVENEAVRAVEWYLAEKRFKAFCSRALRVVAIVAATAGAALPFVVRDGSTGFEWGYFSLAVAAGAMAMDRFFGFSTAWMRYITAELAIQERLQQLRFTWARTQLDHAGRPLTADETREALAVLSDAAASIAKELRSETLSWAEEFQANVSELRTLARPT